MIAATATSTATRVPNAAPATVPRVIAMLSAERMKSVRTAPRILSFSKATRSTAVADTAVDLVAFEKDKIRGAVRTDFILSAESIAITLGTVAGAAFGTRVAVLVAVAAIMTVGVYGLVAGIVKLDDLGAALAR